MILLSTAALPTLQTWRARPGGHVLGRLLTPRHYSRAADTAAAGIPWAADNDGYNGVDEAAFERMIEHLAGIKPGPLFVAVPDVLADAYRTDLLWQEWAPIVKRHGLPAALVLQDGTTADDVPWGAVDALFVGGTDEYKLGPDVRRIARLVAHRRRPPHLHVGRVNSAQRIEYAARLGADSVDGSKWSRWRDTHLPSGIAATESARRERAAPRLFDEAEPLPPAYAEHLGWRRLFT